MPYETSYIVVNGKTVRSIEQHKANPEYYSEKQQVFIVGCKGIPAAYGGFETFVEKLTEYQVSQDIHYHVARIAEDNVRYEYNGAKCFDVKVPNMGPAKAIYYDIKALKSCIAYCKARPAIKKPIFYVLACRIGPFIGRLKKQIKKLGGVLYVNPDGHEWLRAKWSKPVRMYWKLSEKLMVKHADLLICDSKNIESYIQQDYAKYAPKTTFIAYGSDTSPSVLKDDDQSFLDWLQQKNLKKKGYYLVVGRFVPENNYETMIREFMKSKTDKDFALITNVSDAFLNELKEKTHFDEDKRIKFVGTLYDGDLLKKVREQAYGYFHGHEVGGTNPSLLEALGSTDLNLLLGVGFNREVGEDAALYWTKEEGNLAALIEKADTMSEAEIKELGEKAKKRIQDAYSWEYIVDEYEKVFLKSIRNNMDKVRGKHNVIFLTGTIDPSVFKTDDKEINVALVDVQVRLAQYENTIEKYIKESYFTDIVFVENSRYPFNSKKFEDLAKEYDKQFEYLPMELTKEQISEMLKRGKSYGEALLIDFAIKNSKLIAMTDEVYKVTGRVFLKNSKEITKKRRKGITEAICANPRKIFKYKAGWPGKWMYTEFFKIAKADYPIFESSIEYCDDYKDSNGWRSAHCIEQEYYRVAKENKMKVKAFSVYPDLTGQVGSNLNNKYDKNKKQLLIRTLL